MRQIECAMRMSLVAATCGLLLAGCGGGGGSDNSEGRFQTISFQYPGGNTLLNGPTVLQATATSGMAVTFTSGTPNTCTVSGDQLTLVAAGECLVLANQGGGTSANGVQWAAADGVSQLFNVLKHAQVVSFTPPDYVVLGGSSNTVTLSATADTGMPVTYSSSTPTVCSISGDTLTLLAKGSCAVTVTQEGDTNYATTAVQRFIAVDPLLLVDGYAAGGNATAQGGSIGAWAGASADGWWCGDANWCKRVVPTDGSSFTWSYHIQPNDPAHDTGWKPGDGIGAYYGFEVFAPGLSGTNGSGDTTGGLQVTTETSLVLTFGMNSELVASGPTVQINLQLGHFNLKADGNGCNVTVSVVGRPTAASPTSYAIPLENFAVTENCELSSLAKAEDVANPSAESKTAALAELRAYNIIKASFGVGANTVNTSPASTSPTDPTFATDVTLYGAITIQ